MKVKIQVEDTVSEYLEKLEQGFKDAKPLLNQSFAEEIVGSYGGTNSGHIAPLMSTTFNPYLYMSGQDQSKWKYTENEGSSTITVLYSGMGLNEMYSRPKVWSEFGDKFEGVLERDYAYYQETGRDPIAKKEDAKHIGAIARGLQASNQKDLKKVSSYLETLMKGGHLASGNMLRMLYNW
jgi:hypothetical protein